MRATYRGAKKAWIARRPANLPPPLFLDGLDLAHLRGKILDRRALGFRQRVARQFVDEHLEDLADPPELAAVGADIVEDVGFDIRGAGAAEVDGEPAEFVAGEIVEPVPGQDVLGDAAGKYSGASGGCRRRGGMIDRQRREH